MIGTSFIVFSTGWQWLPYDGTPLSMITPGTVEKWLGDWKGTGDYMVVRPLHGKLRKCYRSSPCPGLDTAQHLHLSD